MKNSEVHESFSLGEGLNQLFFSTNKACIEKYLKIAWESEGTHDLTTWNS